jgi:preprotein translocase subunit SecG
MLKFLDLPAHPLFVHGPVVLLPLLALCSLLLAARPSWRTKAWAAFTAGVVFMFGTLFLAMESGEALDEAFKGLAPTKRHIQLAETTRLLSFAFLVLTLVVAALVRKRKRAGEQADVSTQVIEQVAAIAVLLCGLVATVWMIRTGHEGAKAVWSETKL